MWSVSLLVCSTYTSPPHLPAHTLLFLSLQRSKQERRRNKNKRTKACYSSSFKYALCVLCYVRNPDAGFLIWITYVLQRYSSFLIAFCIPSVSAAACPDRGNVNLIPCNSAVSSCPLHDTLHVTLSCSFCCYPLGPAQ